MTRKEAKELLPIIQAFAEGKEIQIKINESKWETVENCTFTSLPTFYRIKAEPKYRPFRTKEECWDEMLKHQPFGWTTDKCKYFHIVCVHEGNIEFSPYEDNCFFNSRIITFAETLEQGFTFADGTPFGIKEE